MRDGTGGLSPGRLVWWRRGTPCPALYRDSSPPSRLTTITNKDWRGSNPLLSSMNGEFRADLSQSSCVMAPGFPGTVCQKL